MDNTSVIKQLTKLVIALTRPRIDSRIPNKQLPSGKLKFNDCVMTLVNPTMILIKISKQLPGQIWEIRSVNVANCVTWAWTGWTGP